MKNGLIFVHYNNNKLELIRLKYEKILILYLNILNIQMNKMNILK